MSLLPRDLVSHWSDKSPSNTAIIAAEGPVTYAMLYQSVSSVAADLRQLGIGSGNQVGLAFPNSIDFIIWLFAIFECGAIACPLDPKQGASETRALLHSAGIDYFAGYQNDMSSEWELIPSPGKAGGLFWHRSTPAIHEGVAAGPEIILRQFTSGSTGKARHILRTEQQLAEDYEHFRRHLRLKDADRFLCVAPFFHTYGALALYACLSAGATIIPESRFVPGEILATAIQNQPTVFLATPPIIELLGSCLLMPGEDKAFNSLEYCICSTGKLESSANEAFTSRYQKPVYIQYGSTETLSATIDLEEGYFPNNVGKPYPGVSIQIFGEHGEILNDGETGKVGIRSPSSCTGYIDDGPPLDIKGEYILPGDQGYIDQDGRLHILGRDDQINIGGYKVDRLEVENIISTNVPVTHVSVIPYLRSGQPALRAIIEADPDQVTAEKITAICKKHLAQYKIPSRIDIYASIPRDANGKVLAGTLDTPDQLHQNP